LTETIKVVTTIIFDGLVWTTIEKYKNTLPNLTSKQKKFTFFYVFTIGPTMISNRKFILGSLSIIVNLNIEKSRI